MKVTSTLSTTCLTALRGLVFKPDSGRPVSRKNSMARLTGGLVYHFLHFWQRISITWQPGQSREKLIASPDVARSSTIILRRTDSEPPDIPLAGPPGQSVSLHQPAFTPLELQPMNERTILSPLYLKIAFKEETGRALNSASVKPVSRVVNSLQKLLFSFITFTDSLQKPALAFRATSLLMLFGLATSGVQAQTPSTIDLSVSQTVSNQKPGLGDVLSYTVVVHNAAGSATATNVVIKDQLPAGGVSYVPNSASTVRGTGSYVSATGLWSLSAVAPGDSAILVLKATVLERGVWFSTAEVMSVDQTDVDSKPNNQSLVEDDYATTCFSVPVYWYTGDEFTVSIPSGYSNITWYRNNKDVSTISADSAVVNADSSLTIKSPGTYRFITYRNGCPALNCCDIEVIQGPYGSLGDYVFIDTNKDGIQNDGATGLNGVKVYLYDATGTTKLDSTITAGGGKYLFDSLTDGSYKVKFVAPTNYTFTLKASTPIDSIDSDAGPDGFTGIYTIDTSKPVKDTARNNPNVDAGLVPVLASLGDFVFVDSNKNGIQDNGEPGISGVVVVLLNGNNTPIATTTTNGSGIYSFTGLTPGVPYSVSFVTPTGYTSTSAQIGGNDAKDSDANPITGQTRSVTLAPGENNQNLDAGYYPSCPTNYSLVASKDATLCYGDSLQITASSVPGAKICWYLTPTDGTSFAIVDNGTLVTVKPTTTTTYYVEATINGCHSARIPVVVTVDVVPTPITTSNVNNICPARTANLANVSITNRDPNLTYEWYTSTVRSQNTQVTNLTAVGSGSYYLFARSSNGCYSSPTVVTVSIFDCNCNNVAGVTIGPGSQATCSVDPVTLRATLSGSATSVTWTSTGTGVFSTPNSLTTTYTPSLADVSSGTALITATTNDPDGPGGVCSAGTSSLILKINTRPDAPTGVACDDTIVCQGSATKLIGFAPGSKINWYDQNNNLLGTTQSGGKLLVKPTTAGINTYYAEAISSDDCTSPTRTAVTVTVGTCLADLAVVKTVVTPGPYSVGQKITYSITASNNGPITGADVKVSELLPSTLTFVGATPSAEYSASNGVWTIGTLTSGSNRNLFIEATINAIGTIKNTAIIGGSNNDPKYRQNDTSSVSIPVTQCDVRAPYIACAITEICKGEVTVLKATGCNDGTIQWSDGQFGATISIKPGLTTTYSAVCVKGNSCTSVASNQITVTVNDPQPPVIVASASVVCPGASVTLTASGCEGGRIEWSEDLQKGPFIVVNPYSKTTYTAQCIINSCPSKPAAKTIDISTSAPTPTIASSATSVCPGGTVTLTVSNCLGTPVWGSTTATTASIIVRPTTGNNTYTVYCSNGACSSKASVPTVIQIISPEIPTISADIDSVCANGKVVLTAYGCTGTVVWNTNQTGSSITVNPAATTSYFAQCKVGDNCLSDPSKSLLVTVVTPSAPIAKADKFVVCSGEVVSLTATGCNGLVKWYGTDKTGPVIQVLPAATTEYYATCKVGNCESDASNKVRITVSSSSGTPPTIAASSLAVCSGSVVSLTATGCAGTVKWSDGQVGAVVSVTATLDNKSFYAVCQPTNSTACASGSSNVIKIDVTPTPKPVITRCVCSTDTICPGEKVKLSVKNCQGTPYWSTKETTESIFVSPSVTTSYTVYCQDGVCKSQTADSYTITVIPVAVPTIVASATLVEAGGTISLTATGCTGDVVWSANGIDGSNKGTVIVVRPEGTQTYYAQCKFHECLSDPSNTITVNKGDCLAKAGTLTPVSPTVCVGTSATVTVAATPNGGLVQPNGYSVLYILTKGAGLVVDQTSSTPSFTVPASAADYTVHTLVYNANPADKNYLDLSVIQKGITTGADLVKLIADRKVCADLDLTGAKVNVKYVAPPNLYAGPSLTVCYGTEVTLTAAGCEGGIVTWSDKSIGQSIKKTIYSDLWMMATCTLNGCTSAPSQSIDVRLGTPNIPAIVVDKAAICTSETVSLTATGCNSGTYVWSDPANTTGNVLTVTPTVTVQYRVKCKIGECSSEWSAYNTITVGVPAAPTVSIVGSTSNTTTTACYGAPVTLVATGCPANTYVTWSNNEVGASITVSPADSATYTARCCTSNQCKSAPSNLVAITLLPKVPQPSIVDKTNACPFNTVDLSTAVTSKAATTGGVFEYYTDAQLTTKVGNPAAVGTGTYYVVEKTVNGCYGLPAAIHVQINSCDAQTPCDTKNPATADAGGDASICAAKTYQLAGKMGGAGKTAYWKTSGNGTFDNPYLLNATYTASAEDLLAGKVTLTLSVSTNNASCPVAKDDMILTIDGSKTVPVVTVVGATNLCYGDSVTLKAPAGASGYLWSNKLTSQTIVVKKSGVYSVQLLDPKGCSSVKSEDVTVKVADPVATPLVSNLRNVCPAKIVDLTKAIASPSASSNYIYRICECNTSNIVMRPDSVCEGTYWIVEKGPTGCLSAPAKVVVKVFNCAADTLTTDVAISKTADKSVVKHGETVTYTLTVSNSGKHTAHNVDVRDVLPAGLELVAGPTPNYTLSNGVLKSHIDSLPVGKTVSIVFAARLLTKGEVVNKAEITYLDNVDTNLANNTSSVTVKDTSSTTKGVIGLAKAVVGTPTVVGDSLIKVRYGFVVSNLGSDTLHNVQLTDDLAYAFSPNTVASATISSTDPAFSLKPNVTFTGIGSNTALFDSSSYITPGQSQTFFLDVTVKRMAGDTTKTFRNIASVSALSNGTRIEDLSVNGGDVDPDNDGDPTNDTGFSTFTLGKPQPAGPSIGVALAVVKVVSLPDSSYNVTYKATVKNFGDVPLTNVSLSDSLVKAFTSPTSYSVVGSPVVGAGSNLVANAAYNGNSESNLLTSASHLGVGEQDTVLITINVKPNGNNGPFYSSVVAEGHTADMSQSAKDVSNTGLDPTPAGSTSTAVRFNLPTGLLGVAKSVGKPTLVETGVYDIPYTITLSNMGTLPLTKVQVVDNLSQTFGHGALIVSNRIKVTTDTGLTADSLYTGQGLITKILVDSMSTLPVGANRSLSFTVRVNVKNADSLTFYNTAVATALTSANVVVADTSTSGTNPDPKNTLDPRDSNTPTPISLNSLSGTSYIGVAMAVSDTVRKPDGSYNVTYKIVVQNFGPEVLKAVSVSDSLSKVFNSQTGATFSIVKAPVITSTGSALKLNDKFDGDANPLLVLGDSTSTLAAGKADTILVVINVSSNGSTTTFLNSVFAQAISKAGKVSDTSTNGLVADLNGNGNPTDLNEREATPLNLPISNQSVFIPEGFSPNGDGINDLFVIRGLNGVVVSLEVYNRWGNLVYKNDDYHNDWDGKPNTGVLVGSDANGLPDGTYYYVIRTSDGRKFVRYMTINR